MGSSLDQLLDRLDALAPDDVAEAARPRVLDALVAATIGATTDVGRSSRGESLLGLWPGSHDRVDSDDDVLAGTAALARLVRCTETDDIDLTSCVTTAAIAVPAALGGAFIAARRDGGNRSADQLLVAVAAGYEAAIRLGETLEGPFALYRGIWPTLAVAPVAAAAAAAVALGQSRTDIAATLAAAARIAVPARPEGEARWSAFGDAVRAGVAAAAFPARGPQGTVESSAYQVMAETEVGEEADNPQPRIRDSRMKHWASAAQLAAAIDATCVLADQHELVAGEVEHICVFVPAYYARMIDRSEITDRVSSLLSAQYQLAVAISNRDDLYDCARTTRRSAPAFRRLMGRISVEVDDLLAADYPREWPAHVRIDARRSSFEMTSNHRSPDPDWTAEKVEAKAERLFQAAGLGSSAPLCASIRNFHEVNELLGERTAAVPERAPRAR